VSVWLRATAATGVAVLLLAVPAALAYRQARGHQRDLAQRESAHLLDLERAFVERELRSMRADLAYLAQQPLPGRVLDGELGALRALEREYLGFARAKPRYVQVRLLDRTGLERVRINRRGDALERVEASRLQPKGDRPYFQEAIGLPLGSVFVSPLDLNVERGEIERPPRPVIRLAAPVRGSLGVNRGLLVLNYAGGLLLDELRRLAAASGGATALLNVDGEYLLADDPALEWGWLLGRDAAFRGDHPEVWARLLDAEQIGAWRDGERLSARWVALGEGAPVGPNAVAIVSRMPVRAVFAPRARAAAAGLAAGALAVLYGLSYVWARAAAARRDQEQRIADSEARLRLLSRQLLAAQEDERRSLSRLLHDELGQAVTAIGLDLKNAARHSGDPATRASLERASADTEGLLASLHEIATRVRPSVLDDLGLAEALESHVAEFEQRTGIVVALSLDLPGPAPARPLAENVYRIVQEALANVAAHAEVEAACVEVEADDATLSLSVEDAGRGFDPARLKSGGRLGILGMRERVELLGGEFSLDSAAGQGTRLRVRLPREAE